MTRTLGAILFLCGCAAGATVAYIQADGSRDRTAAGSAAAVAARGTNPGSEWAGDATDANTMLTRIISAARSRTARDSAGLRVLLSRFVELDPTLAALGALDDPFIAKTVASSLLDILGNNRSATERILQALPRVDALSFEVEALARASGDDPRAAIRRALAARDPAVRRLAIPAIAVALADRNPQLALELASIVPEPRLEEAFTEAVYSRWAELDAGAVLDHLEHAGDTELALATSALEMLALADPHRVLDLAQRLGRRDGFTIVYAAAVAALTERDPVAGMVHLNGLPPGQERVLARSAVAAGYVDRAPAAALIWAQTLDPPSPDTVSAVMTAIAARDLEQAFELAIAAMAAGRSAGMDSMAWMTRNDAVDSATMARIGERIAALDPPSAEALISRFGEAWSVSDPDAALDWALVHDEVGEAMFGNLALNYASRDLEAALASLERIPPDRQDQWLQLVFTSVGDRIATAQDRERILSLLAEYESHPSYDRIAAAVAWSASISVMLRDPGSTQAFIESLPEGELRTRVEAAIEAGL